MEIIIILIVSVCAAAYFGNVVGKRNSQPERSETWKQGYDAGYKKGAEYVLSAIRPVVNRMHDTYRKQAD